jgi:BirA family biotin operon repressor/biotin-[acetyl-CoA-carboxylase] ligase
VEGAKLAGILSSAGPPQGTPPRPSFVVVGLGLNVGWAPDGAVCLANVASRVVDRDQVLVALLASLDGLLASSDEQLHARYREHLSSLGREVRVELPNDRFVEGRALDVEDDGRLVVLDSCGVTHRLDVGDVVHLR